MSSILDGAGTDHFHHCTEFCWLAHCTEFYCSRGKRENRWCSLQENVVHTGLRRVTSHGRWGEKDKITEVYRESSLSELVTFVS